MAPTPQKNCSTGRRLNGETAVHFKILRRIAPFAAFALQMIWGQSAFGDESAQRPKVSILMAVYDCEAYLPAALESAQKQTIGDIEIVCVDDGSTDGSLSILRSHGAEDGRIRVFANGTNRGTHYSRMRAIAESRGDFILWLDGDDELADDIGERAWRKAVATGADVVLFNADWRNGKWERCGGRVKKWMTAVGDMAGNGRSSNLITMLLDGAVSVHCWNKMWRGENMRAMAEALMPFSESHHIVKEEDSLLFWFAVKFSKSYTSISSVGYRHRASSGLSARKRGDKDFTGKKLADFFAIQRKMVFDESNPRDRARARAVLRRMEGYVQSMIVSLPEEEGFAAFDEYLGTVPEGMRKSIEKSMGRRNGEFFRRYRRSMGSSAVSTM
ncbi:MAG: glycosyltransferase [Puniceicoccales bacterium]|jgi:hypothetical protein|nr:glycosyltransferase [Puniceicoccales bacterium]